jgi:hypothetical protein
MKRNAFQLLKPLKVVQLGPERKTQPEELPSGAQVRILREYLIADCIDIAYENERYFALKSDLLCRSEDLGMSLRLVVAKGQ